MGTSILPKEIFAKGYLNKKAGQKLDLIQQWRDQRYFYKYRV